MAMIVIVGAAAVRLITWSPSQTCHAKPKTQINRRRTLPASFLLVGCLPQEAYLVTFSEKVRTLWHCSRLRSVALYLWLIVVDIRQAPTVAAISGLHCWALVMVVWSIRLDSLIAKFKEAGGTVREIDVWAESMRLSPSLLSASSSACHGLLTITVITPLPTKPSDKNARELCWRTRHYWRRCVSVDVAAPMQNTRRSSWCEAEKWCSAWWWRRWSSSVFLSKQSVSQCVKPPRPPAWIRSLPLTGRHRWTGLFPVPQREADHYAKTTGRNPEVY